MAPTPTCPGWLRAAVPVPPDTGCAGNACPRKSVSGRVPPLGAPPRFGRLQKDASPRPKPARGGRLCMGWGALPVPLIVLLWVGLCGRSVCGNPRCSRGLVRSGAHRSRWDRGCHDLHRRPVGRFAPFWLIWDIWDVSMVASPLPQGLGTSAKAPARRRPLQGVVSGASQPAPVPVSVNPAPSPVPVHGALRFWVTAQGSEARTRN